MIKFIFIILFIIPLCFIKNFWLNYIIYNLLIIFSIIKLSFNYSFINININFGCDLLRYIIFILRLWICSLIILSRDKIYLYKNFYNLFNFNLLVLILSLTLTFLSINFFLFYLFFEISLIPTLLLILGWGFQPERIQAGLYLFFYTIFGSLPILISIFFYFKINYRLRLFFFNFYINSLIIFFCMTIVFFVKIPLFFLHLWLPKAHTEAPVSGSIILAGVILKLGGYGLIRLLPIFIKINFIFNYIFVSISLIGGLVVSLICLRQRDIKSLVAYSSVAHMGLIIRGLITFSYWGVCRSITIIIAHGLCSSGLFCLVNINYERINRRRLYLNKGIINLLPNLSLFWFLLCSRNIAAPPSLNLMSEIFLINRIARWNYRTIIFIALISFFSAAYSLYLFSYTQHGNFFSRTYMINLCNIREYMLLIMHWLPLNILFLKSELLVLWIYLNSLIKILICGIKDIIFILSYFNLF